MTPSAIAAAVSPSLMRPKAASTAASFVAIASTFGAAANNTSARSSWVSTLGTPS